MADIAAFELDSENPALGGGGGTSGTPTDLSYDDIAKELLLSASNPGDSVTEVIENTSNSASAEARLIVRNGGTTTNYSGINLETPGGTSWEILSKVQLLRFDIQRVGGFPVFAATANYVALTPAGDLTTRAFQFTHGNTFQGLLGGSILNGVLTGTEVMNLLGDYGGTAGRGIGIAMRDSTANLHKYGILLYNRAGAPELQIIPNGGNVLVGGAAAPASLAGGIVIFNGTAPSANPTTAGALWVESGALKYRGSGGTVTTLGAA